MKSAAGRSFQILWQAIEPFTHEDMRQAAAVGAWALVHGLSHLIANRQLPQEQVFEDEIDVLIEGMLAIYRRGLIHDIARPR
jgi:hypothetical protein